VKPPESTVKCRIRKVGAPLSLLISHLILTPFAPSSVTGATGVSFKLVLYNENSLYKNPRGKINRAETKIDPPKASGSLRRHGDSLLGEIPLGAQIALRSAY